MPDTWDTPAHSPHDSSSQVQCYCCDRWVVVPDAVVWRCGTEDRAMCRKCYGRWNEGEAEEVRGG